MFTIEQTYDLAGLTELCRVSRKTNRRAWCVFRGVLWCVFDLGTAVWLALLVAYGSADVWTLVSELVILFFLLFEDRINAWVALRQMLPGTSHSVTVFNDDAYTVATDTAETKYLYQSITGLCETERYFVFFLGKKHGQLFAKQVFRTGTPDAFRAYLEKKTGKSFQKAK